jgi:hypothetical protein
MHTARSDHAAVYHSQYLYVLGYRECERYVSAESEVLPALPVACIYMSRARQQSLCSWWLCWMVPRHCSEV